jgi:hypothetical protein
MNISQFKRLSLWSLIGFLSLSALIAIGTLLSGNFGETQIKVILTTLTISGASICAMACSAFIERRGGSGVGVIGIVCAVIAAGLAIGGIWGEAGNDGYWKTTITTIIISAALAHSLLLFIPVLPLPYRWSQGVLAFAVAVLASLIIVAMWGEISDAGYYRLMGVAAVFVVLLTLIVPICSRLGPTAQHKTTDLTLRQEDGDVYRDTSGQLYRVTKI